MNRFPITFKHLATSFTLFALVACGPQGDAGVDSQFDSQASTRNELISDEMRALLANDYLPDAVSSRQTPWGGGAIASKWQAEAIVANAASAKLNAAWKDPNVTDVLVAIPTKLKDSKFNPYGDGQTNSEVTFPFWNEKRPPLTLIKRTNSASEVTLSFDSALALSQTQIEIAYQTSPPSAAKRLFLSGVNTGGTLSATWVADPQLKWDSPGHLLPVFVRPAPGFGDWFPVYFRMPRHSLTDFVASVPPSMRTFPIDGKPILDPEKLRGGANGKTPLETALLHRFPSYRYNVNTLGPGGSPAPYVPANVHAELGRGGRPTAVGRGFTWVAERNTPFKAMYTGFDGRDVSAEAQYGVPSGSGWHVMGDPITLINHEEQVPLLAGAGFSNPAVRFGLSPPDNGYAYQLADVVVLRLLLPGEALVTVPTLFPSRDQDHQWYAIPLGPRGRGFLAEEWVSPKRPVGDNPKFQ